MDSFYKRGEKERLAFSQIIEKLKEKLPEGYEIYYYITTNESNTRYDVLAHVYDENGNKKLSNIFEVKIRDVHYSELMLEKKKFNYLMKLKAREEKIFPRVKTYYLNFTPKGTYMFDLEKYKLEWESRYLPSTTVNNKSKEWKDVTFLNCNYGMDLRFIFDAKLESNKELDKRLNEQKAWRCIFKSVEDLK